MTATLAAFALAATLLILSPGPDSMLVLRSALRGGRRAGWVTGAGILSGLLVWATAAAFGLSALLRASATGYDILRVLGACYLAWLGVTSLGLFRRSRRAALAVATAPAADIAAAADAASEPDTSLPAGAQGTGYGPAYLSGLVCNLLNPKIGVFFIAFLPGFIPARSAVPAMSFGLGFWFVAETAIWLATLAWLAERGVSWLRRPVVERRLERFTGVVLLGFAVRLALENR
jgi:threonine/homoserine/homoserine lactone efflux protein